MLKIAAGASAFEAVPPAFGEVVVAAAAAVVDIAAAAAAAAVVDIAADAEVGQPILHCRLDQPW